MISQKAPKESDEQRVRREREEQRADNAVTENLQNLVSGQTRKYRQRFGLAKPQSPSGPMIGQLINQILASQLGATGGAGTGTGASFLTGGRSGGPGNSSLLIREA